jgi:organic hydroperoxide reductase OsmC/OhrA
MPGHARLQTNPWQCLAVAWSTCFQLDPQARHFVWHDLTAELLRATATTASQAHDRA